MAHVRLDVGGQALPRVERTAGQSAAAEIGGGIASFLRRTGDGFGRRGDARAPHPPQATSTQPSATARAAPGGGAGACDRVAHACPFGGTRIAGDGPRELRRGERSGLIRPSEVTAQRGRPRRDLRRVALGRGPEIGAEPVRLGRGSAPPGRDSACRAVGRPAPRASRGPRGHPRTPAWPAPRPETVARRGDPPGGRPAGSPRGMAGKAPPRPSGAAGRAESSIGPAARVPTRGAPRRNGRADAARSPSPPGGPGAARARRPSGSRRLGQRARPPHASGRTSSLGGGDGAALRAAPPQARAVTSSPPSPRPRGSGAARTGRRGPGSRRRRQRSCRPR